MRVPLTDLMGKIQSHESARKRRIAAVNQRWSFTKSPTGWPVFKGVTSVIMILGIGYLIYLCCRAGYCGPVNIPMAGAVPKGGARDIRQTAAQMGDLDMGDMGDCPCLASGAEATIMAVLVVVL